MSFGSTSRHKRRRIDGGQDNEHVDPESTDVKNGESVAALRNMVLGKLESKLSQTVPGKYIAIDCEMVGIGIDGKESSLARVSIVDYTGAVVLDAFVQQRERVVDYRTQWSGIRSTDLAGSAKPFKEVQQAVADLIKDRILVGHAIHNDLKALLLSHPSPQVRDTQSLAYKYRVVKSRRPALRVLVKQELDIIIQSGEHSSVTDARATMALFRLHRKQWESKFRPLLAQSSSKSQAEATPPAPPNLSKKRKRKESTFGSGIVSEGQSSPRSRARSPTQHTSTSSAHHKRQSGPQPSGGSGVRKGISSGISTVIRKAGGRKEINRNGARIKDEITGKSRRNPKGERNGAKNWWTSLGGE